MKIVDFKFRGDAFFGPLVLSEYVDGSPALVIAGDCVSINLSAYGLVPRTGCVFIKDWFEGTGMTDALVEAGAVEKVEYLSVGQFNSPAWMVRVLLEDETEPDEDDNISHHGSAESLDKTTD